MKYLLCIAMLWIAGAAGAAERVLPALALADKDGSAAALTQLNASPPWVVMVVDAGKPQTAASLARLYKKDGDWGDKLVVVVNGSAAAMQTLMSGHRALAGVQWYRDTSGTAMQSLHLAGLPAVLGINAKQQIVWQSIGLPQQTEKAQSLVASWINGGAK